MNWLEDSCQLSVVSWRLARLETSPAKRDGVGLVQLSVVSWRGWKPRQRRGEPVGFVRRGWNFTNEDRDGFGNCPARLQTAPTFLEDRAYFFGRPCLSCVVIGFQLGFTFVLPNLRDETDG